MVVYAITPRPDESAWLRYRLELAESGVTKIAKQVGVGRSAVSQVISGKAHSARIEEEIARILGYPGWNEMLKRLRSGTA